MYNQVFAIRPPENDALGTFQMPWTHVAMQNQKLDSELEKYLIRAMCVKAADGLELQCAREYWADNDNDDDQRVTAIHKLTPEEQSNLPTESLEAERYLAKFGALASISARHSNRFFKAKHIRDDLTLNSEHHADNHQIQKPLQPLTKWSRSGMLIKRLCRKLGSKIHWPKASEFVAVILKKCKEHGGPVTDIREMNQITSKFNERETKKFLRQEIKFQKAIHNRDSQEHPDVHKINNLFIDQLTENLGALGSDNVGDNSDNVLFSTEDEIMEILLERPVMSDNSLSKPVNESHQPVAVLWGSAKGRDWFVGFHIDENDDTTIRVDHLEPKSNDNTVWIRP